jgi:hypothetical protein
MRHCCDLASHDVVVLDASTQRLRIGVEHDVQQRRTARLQTFGQLLPVGGIDDVLDEIAAGGDSRRSG